MKVVLLTAVKGTGKTSVCIKLIEMARNAGLACGGILAPAVFQGDVKTGIDVLDLATRRKRLLATRESDLERCTVGPWAFDEVVLAWAVDCALLAADRPLDLLFVDEIGPLELNQGKGYAPVLERLPYSPARLAVLPVRPDLVSALQRRLPGLECVVAPVTLSNRDALPGELLAMLGR